MMSADAPSDGAAAEGSCGSSAFTGEEARAQQVCRVAQGKGARRTVVARQQRGRREALALCRARIDAQITHVEHVLHVLPRHEPVGEEPLADRLLHLVGWLRCGGRLGWGVHRELRRLLVEGGDVRGVPFELARWYRRAELASGRTLVDGDQGDPMFGERKLQPPLRVACRLRHANHWLRLDEDGGKAVRRESRTAGFGASGATQLHEHRESARASRRQKERRAARRRRATAGHASGYS